MAMSIASKLDSDLIVQACPLSPAQVLPPEILSIIFNLISYQSCVTQIEFLLTPQTALSTSPAARHSTAIHPLTLVCRNWHLPACEVLFRHLTISSPGQLPAILANSRRCLPFVKHARVLWNRQPWVLPEDPDLALIPLLLDLCENVDRLTLAGEQFDLSSPALLSSMNRRSSRGTPHSPILHLSCCAIETPFFHQRFGPQGRRTSETIGSLLLACPDLIEGRWDEFRSAYSLSPALPEADRMAPNLRKIAFQRVVLESSNLEKLLCPLGGQLRELFLDRTSLATCESWRMILGKLGQSLEVLELKDCDFWATWEVNENCPPLIDATLLACPALRSLVLLGSLDSIQPTFSRIHHNLGHFTVGCRYIEPKTLSAAIIHNRFPKLMTLHIEATCEWSDDGESIVQNACVQSGVTWSTGWNLD